MASFGEWLQSQGLGANDAVYGQNQELDDLYRASGMFDPNNIYGSGGSAVPSNSSLGVVRPDMSDAEASDRYMVQLIQAGYQPLGAEWHDPAASSLDYYNQTYGLNLQNLGDYYKHIYGLPNAQVVNDPIHGQLLKLPEGFDAFSKPGLTYNPNPNEELIQALLAGTIAFGGAAAAGGLGLLGTGTAAGTGAGAAGIEAAVAGGALEAGAAGTAATAGTGAAATGAGLTGFGETVATTYPYATVGTVTGTPLAAAAAGTGGVAGAVTTAAGKVAATSGLTAILESMGVSAATAKTIGDLFPGVTAASILAGTAQGALGYLGAKVQADAYESAGEKQTAAYREAIAAAEKARSEQNAAYAKAYDASVAARGVQNSYIQQAIDEVKRGQVSQDAAIQSGIDYSKGASEKYFGLGAPYRAKLESSYQPGFSVWDDSATRDAASQAASYAARGYSATSGNPFDQPSAQGGIYRDVLSQVALPQLNKYRDQLGTFSQIGLTQAGAMDQLTTAGLASLGANDMAAAPYIASLGANAFQGINYLANQADSGKYTDYIASIGNNAFQGVQNAGSGLNAIAAGASTALNPPLTKQDLLEFMKTYKPTV